MQSRNSLLPNGKLSAVLLVILTLGVVAAVALIFASLLALGYLINLRLSAGIELSAALSTTYAQADSLGRVLFIGILVYLIVHLAPELSRSARRAWRIA